MILKILKCLRPPIHRRKGFWLDQHAEDEPIFEKYSVSVGIAAIALYSFTCKYATRDGNGGQLFLFLSD